MGYSYGSAGGGTEQYAAGLLMAAAIGGTLSRAAGGKFANGAMSSAMTYTMAYAGGAKARREAEEKPEHHYTDLENGNVRLSYGGAGSGVYAEGTRAQMESLAVSLDKLYAVPSTRAEINALIGTSRDTPLIVLETGGITGEIGDNTSISTGQIAWHPSRAGRYNAPPFVALGHEIHHAYEFITGTIQGMSHYTGQNPPWEMGAFRAENLIRAHYRIPLKQNYTTNIYSYEPGRTPVMVLPQFDVSGN